MKYKTGLLPSPEPPKLAFKTYLLPHLLPPIPPTFGHQYLYPRRGWGMLGNNVLGDCTVAGSMHAVMLWRSVIKKPVRFTTLDAKEDYFAITGGVDSGADMVAVAKYWQSIGFRDSKANRHKILAYMQTDPANLEHADAACFLFDAVGLGIEVGEAEMNDFSQGRPWDDPNTSVDGYHYVPYVGKDFDYRYVVTWGGIQPVTERWYKAKVNEVVPILSDEDLLADGKSEDGFDMDALMADLEAVG
jgi:hypothetical protein